MVGVSNGRYLSRPPDTDGMRFVRLLISISFVVAASALSGQTASDIIRGKVTDDSSKVVVGASIFVTRGPDRAVKPTVTDSTGRYAITFENGTGDYLVAVNGAGYKTARRRVQRVNAETEFTADFVLSHDAATLAAVKVTAAKPTRASNDVNPYQTETGANEKWADGVAGRLPPSLAGDVSALAATMPGITVGANGLSMLGASSESNLTTLNGMSMAGGSLPRAARTDTRVTGATFDPTRGGFSGANIDVHLSAGSRNYQQRNFYFTGDTPGLQFTDAVGRSLGARTQSVRASVGADGEVIRRAMTYNVALDFSRATSDPATLLGTDADAFARAGISRDSAQRAIAIARMLGVPLGGAGIPSQRETQSVTWLGRLDDTRDSLDQRTFTTYASWRQSGALNFGPLSAPSTGGEQAVRTLGAQLQFADFVGEGRRVLTQTKLGLNSSHTQGTPYLRLPGANVRVVSSTTDGDGIASLGLGGSSFLANTDNRWTAEGSNETIWNAKGQKHVFKAFVWARADGLTQSGFANTLGQYSYNSLADFANGRAASFSRTLSQPQRDGAVWNGASAFAHSFAPSRWFSLMYGARVEANGFVTAPTANPALARALGVSTGVAPTLFHVSPRIGFTWTYNRDRDNGNGAWMNRVGQFYRTTTGVLRGGIGEFRDLLKPDLVAGARANSGLAGGTQSLSCVGSAVPSPDWSQFLADANNVPTRCADGSTALADLAPPVSLISRSYDVPRSWRASLDWNTNIGWMTYKMSALGSYDLNQPGIVDANFAGVSKFALAGEGNRPVFVSPSSIDPASGAVSSAESRRSAQYGSVGIRTGDLRGYGGQLTFGLAPDIFRLRRVPGSPYLSLGYTIQESRREFRGFDGAAFGDPRTKEWAPGVNDARHIFVLQGGFYFPNAGAVTFFARAQSGLPFTPIVQGDVNGDGRGGDRAFIPDPNSPADAVLSAQLRSLLANGSAAARSCVTEFAGHVAARNGCRGPWTSSLNVQWRPQLPPSVARRIQAMVYFENALGGLDQLLHGSENLRGWGERAVPDPVLFVPHGFDASTRRFAYDVNPQFADTRPSHSLARTPFRISIDFHLDLTTDYELQTLRRAVEPVKVNRQWERRGADSLTAFYLQNTSDIYRMILSESDSLFLRTGQIAALQRADSVFSVQVRRIYGELGAYLAQFPDGNVPAAALDSANASKKAYWKVFWEQPEIADSLMTSSQKQLMPIMTTIVTVPKKDREHSQWQFGWPILLTDPRRVLPK
jgi:hypothetical protein